MYPIFSSTKKISEISGIHIKKIREYYKLQLIPNEKVNRDYRIITQKALDILKKRAEDFVGHYYIKEIRFNPPPII